MFNAILTSIIFFLNILRYVSTAEKFLCQEFYGGRNVVQKLNSISPNTPRHRLIILNASSYGWLNFDDAVDICRLCLNATLVVQDDVTQIAQYTPTWIGVRSRMNETPTSTSGWEWVDGSGPLNRWQLNFASSINLLFPPGISYKGYAILAENDNQASDSSTQIKWSAYGTDETAGSRSNSHHYYYEDRRQYITFSDEDKRKYIQYLICRRPLQTNCQYWNYTEDRCMTNADFGCHNYINMIYQPSDNQTIECDVPKHRRLAYKCPCSNCTCPVTEWSNWSSCGLEQCTTKKVYRFRSRNESEPCPVDHLHQDLIDREECTIPGCEELLSAKANDTCWRAAITTVQPHPGFTEPENDYQF